VIELILAAAITEPTMIKTPDGYTFMVQPIDERPLPPCVEYVMPDGSVDCYYWQRPAPGKEDRK
jgi:hypothetical protein